MCAFCSEFPVADSGAWPPLGLSAPGSCDRLTDEFSRGEDAFLAEDGPAMTINNANPNIEARIRAKMRVCGFLIERSLQNLGFSKASRPGPDLQTRGLFGKREKSGRDERRNWSCGKSGVLRYERGLAKLQDRFRHGRQNHLMRFVARRAVTC